MNVVFYFISVVWVSICFAKVEIAIEGKNGWAENLPTWRLPRRNWVSKVFFFGKPATGYHLWMELFVFSFLHTVYAYMPFSLSTEFALIAFLCFFSILEDFFWFVLNPAFGIAKFHKGDIPWHKKWLWIAPPDYFILLAMGLVFYLGHLSLPV